MDRIAAVVNIVTRQTDGRVFGGLQESSGACRPFLTYRKNSCKRFKEEWYSCGILTTSLNYMGYAGGAVAGHHLTSLYR
jgi:hypothetical protein